MGKRDRAPQKAVAGNYIAIPYALFDSPAYAGLSARAKDVVNAIARSFNGFNNGRIPVSREQIASRTGSHNYAANRAAIAEAASAGVIAVERVYPRGSRLSTEYRLCYYETGEHPNKSPASQEYLACSPQRRKRTQPGNKSRPTTEHESLLPGSMIEHDGKLSGSMIEPHKPLNDALSCSSTEQHIDYQGERLAAEAGCGEETSERHAPNELGRPKSVTGDRWMLAGIRAAHNPAGPDPAALRQRVTDYIQKHGVGSQTRLATSAGLLGGTLSKFLNGHIDLPNRHRVNLTCAMAREAANEAKLRPSPAMSSKPPRERQR